MAERIHWWTERCLRSPLFLSLSLTIYLPTYPSSIYLSVYLSICLSVYLSICLSVYLSICLSICLSVYLSICLSVYLSICLSVYLSICPSIYLSIHLSIYLSVCLSVHLSIYLSFFLSIYLSIYLSILLSISLSVYKPMYLSLKIFFKCPTPASIFGNATKPSRFAHFCQGAQSLAPATRSDIWTSKSAPNPSVFCTFDLEICFATQRRALFRHLNVQKWSENGVFCTFWLRNVLRTTTACTFSTSQLPKVVRHWGVLYIFTSKCASRHNGVRISTSKSVPRPRCFVPFHLEMCFAPQRRAIFDLSSGPAGSAPAALASLLFDPPELQIIRKTQCFATFLPFRASASSFFWPFLFYSSLF